MDLRIEINRKKERLKEINQQIAQLKQEEIDLTREIRGLSVTLQTSQGRRISVDMRYGLVEKIRQ